MSIRKRRRRKASCHYVVRPSSLLNPLSSLASQDTMSLPTSQKLKSYSFYPNSNGNHHKGEKVKVQKRTKRRNRKKETEKNYRLFGTVNPRKLPLSSSRVGKSILIFACMCKSCKINPRTWPSSAVQCCSSCCPPSCVA